MDTIDQIMKRIDEKRNTPNTDRDHEAVAEELKNAPRTAREAIENGDEALAEEIH